MLAACAGVVAWMVFGVGPRPASLGALALAFAAIGAALAAAKFDGAAAVAPLAVVAPTLLAVLTASRGEGDGLWRAVIVLLLAMIVLPVGTALLVGSVVQRWAYGPSTRMARALAALGVVVAGAALATLWPRPFDSLEREIATFGTPAGLRLASTDREGDPLCSEQCSAVIARTYVGTGQDLCAGLEAAVAAWADGVDRRTGECKIVASRPGGPLGGIVVSTAVVDGGLVVRFKATCRPGPTNANVC